MRKLFIFVCSMFIMRETMSQIPKCEKKPYTIEMFGDKRVDDYYWLNQYWLKGPDAPQVVQYLELENGYYDQVMQPYAKLKETLYQEMVGRIKQTDQSVPYFKNGYWYISKTLEGQEYAVYTRRKGSMEAPEELLLDGNKMGAGKSYFALGGLNVSPNNKILAYGIDTVSRRKYRVYFKDLETGKLLADEIPVTTGGVTWANDNKTVFYTQQNETTLRSERVMKHVLGTPVSSDELVYYEADETFSVGVGKTKSEAYIFIESGSTLSSELRFVHADRPAQAFQVFLPREKDLLYTVDHYQNDFYIVTNWDARNFRLMKCPITATDKRSWTELIPHRTDVLLEGIEIFKDQLVISERAKGLTQIRVQEWKSRKEHYLDFGEPAYVAGVGYNPDFNTSTLRFSYQSMATPPSTYAYDMNTKNKTLLKQQEILGGFQADQYVTERLWANAKDGTKIPISIVYKKGFKKDGTRPLFLYAYGSYGVSSDPTFSITRLSLLDRGFAFAIAHVRGGQEMGRSWYEDGKMFKKKNTFTDFIDCAEYLIGQGYTQSSHLYASGGSAGGLLMGAIVNMRPDLWKGVIAAVPFVDVVTTMLDETIPLTTSEFDEWGNPKNKESYFYMKSYSPYDNVERKAYPNMLVTTGLHDSQVQYFEPAKWVAKLREYKTDKNILLLQTNMEAGHGGASGRFRRLKETARDYAFILSLEEKK
jgi:oligopeptidase B